MKDQGTLGCHGNAPGTNDASQDLNILIERMAYLKKVSLFSELSIAELGYIAKIACEEEFPDETILIQEGQVSQKLYLIVRGFVEISACLSEGQHGSLRIVGPPDCLGEDSIFNNSPSPVSAQVVMGQARTITMSGEDLKRLIRLYPEIGIGLLASLSNRVQKLEKIMIQLGK
jgi:CRP-like cAMP-binding protein